MNEGLARPAQVFAVDAMQFRGTPAGFRIFPVVLLILFGLVLLIGSVNVAGVLLARAASREHELTIRAALGASRARVIQAMLVESFLLSLLGASAGMVLALAFTETGLPGPLAGLSDTIAPDRRLLVPGLLLVPATTVLCGAVPALRSSRANVVTALRKSGTGTTARFNARSAFIVGQVAVSLTLLVVSSLCLRSQLRIFTVDVGFDLDHGAVARFTAETPRPAAARAAFIDQLVERIEQTPGVRSAAVTSLVPLGGDALVASFHPAGRSDIPGTRPSTVSVGPRYFETLAIPLLRGREFTTADREGTPPVVIVNQTFAETYFGAANPLGQRVETGGEANAEIVGVVANSKLDTIGEAPKSVLYYPFAQRPRRLTVIARTAGDPAPMLPAVRRAMTELDAGAGVSVGTLRDAAGTELTMRRVGTQFVGAIGILGLLLTGIGLYGVVSYLVASRTAELGIRLALGATPGRLHREVLGQAARLVAGGIALGVPAAMLIASALKTFLAGLSPLDPIAFAGGGGGPGARRVCRELSAGAQSGARRSAEGPPRVAELSDTEFTEANGSTRRHGATETNGEESGGRRDPGSRALLLRVVSVAPRLRAEPSSSAVSVAVAVQGTICARGALPLSFTKNARKRAIRSRPGVEMTSATSPVV